MKITEIRTYKMQVPLVRPFRIALGLITHAVSCLVEIETDEGITGYGEGSPGPLITGENLEGTVATIERLKEKLIGMDPCDMEAIWTVMNRAVAYDGSAKQLILLVMIFWERKQVFRFIRSLADFPMKSRLI